MVLNSNNKTGIEINDLVQVIEGVMTHLARKHSI
jgi:hypothetical protein